MLLIRTAEGMARALNSSLDTELKELLQARVARLPEYEGYTLEDLAEFLIIEAADRLVDIERAYGKPLVGGGCFTFPVEWITLLGRWREIGWVQSDDGYGLVLYVEEAPGTDASLRDACRAAAASAEAPEP